MVVSNWLLSVLLLGGSLAFSQDLIIAPNTETLVKLSPKFELRRPTNRDQYIANSWFNGKLFYTNGSSKLYDSLNFDRFANVIEVVVNNRSLTILPMGLSGALIQESPTTGYVLVSGKIENEYKFLLLKSAGKYLLASVINTSEMELESNYKTDEIRFVAAAKDVEINETYYLWRNLVWEDFKMSKTAVTKLFDKDKKEMKEILAPYNLDNSKEYDMVWLFNKLNENDY